MIEQPYLYIIAGANGSDKSTLAGELLPEENLEFLNADDIAKEICPQNIERVRIQAGKEFLKRLDLLFEAKKSFAIETTLAGNNHIKTVKKAKSIGYKVVLVYSYIDSPQMCINRIKIRVLNGGHFVPDIDVERRFYRSKNNFWNKYKDIVDEWNLFYNGSNEYILVAQNSENETIVFNENSFNEFIKEMK